MTDNAEIDALTEEQVYALPEGTPISVTWSGGNGPHPYVLLFHQLEPYACREGDEDNPRMRYYNPLTFVGQERYHTRVWTRDIPPGQPCWSCGGSGLAWEDDEGGGHQIHCPAGCPIPPAKKGNADA